ncbi:MAG: aminotransferase class V-fold PLP-dependent enzyme [Pseudomonadales bacterium]
MTTSRRRFLGVTGAAALAGATASAGAPRAAGQAAAEPLPDRVAAARAAFAFTEARVPMNAANLCPAPRAVAAAVAAADADIDADCSFQNRARFSAELERTRAALARQLGVSADTVALVRNTSEGNNVVNAGLDLAAGDEVVIWNENHPTNHVAWTVRAARHGLVVRTVTLPDGAAADAGRVVEAFTAAFTPRTRVLAFSQVSNLSGIALPAAALTEAAQRRGIHVHVDGAQTWGVLDLDLHVLGFDSFAASAHKWYMGPREVGLLYVRESAIPRIWPGVVAPGWGDDADPDPVGARKFESLGQRDDAALAGMAVAAAVHDALNAADRGAVEAYVRGLMGRLLAGVGEAGLTPVTPRDESARAGVCVVEVASDRRAEVFERLYREHGIAGATTGGLRLCPHVYNTPEHVDRAVAALRALRPLILGRA